MIYQESGEILEKIKESKKILLNCHRNPDPDSVSSALSFKLVLERMGKKVTVASPDPVSRELSFLPGYEEITITDFNNIPLGDYDIFITLDSSEISRMFSEEKVLTDEVLIINIDHHETNANYGHINLVDWEAASTCTMLYHLFTDWEIIFDQELATTLLTGIISDSGSFQFQKVRSHDFEIAKKLIEYGADREKIVFYTSGDRRIELMKYWGVVLVNLGIDRDHGFAYSKVDYEQFASVGKPMEGPNSAATLFIGIVQDTDFGVMMTEVSPRETRVSFRSRSDVDVARIASEVGGGGHKVAAGAIIDDLDFDKAVEKVLTAARKYAKK